MSKRQKAYTAAGVDIDLGNRVKGALPALLASTHRREVLGKVGGFGGLFALDLRRHREPVLVSSVDGVGTKLKIAFAMNRHDTVGQDLVNHCVNDIAVLGAEPLFFLDYVGTGKLEPRVFTAIIRGFAKACAENHCALIGGETAQMPGFYQPGEYDLSGTIVGVVEKDELLNGPRSVKPGDAVIGLASNGLHTNGFSLARRILFEQLKLEPARHMAEFGQTLGDELLKVHVSYGPVVSSLLGKFNRRGSMPMSKGSDSRRTLLRVHPRRGRAALGTPSIRAFAHITGGGFTDNIPRILPQNCDVVIRKASWELPPIFRLLRDRSGIEEAELYQVFNMGIGMVAITEPDLADAVLRFVRRQGHASWIIGEVVRGGGKTRLT